VIPPRLPASLLRHQRETQARGNPPEPP
jgi:hypothetical protein